MASIRRLRARTCTRQLLIARSSDRIFDVDSNARCIVPVATLRAPAGPHVTRCRDVGRWWLAIAACCSLLFMKQLVYPSEGGGIRLICREVLTLIYHRYSVTAARRSLFSTQYVLPLGVDAQISKFNIIASLIQGLTGPRSATHVLSLATLADEDPQAQSPNPFVGAASTTSPYPTPPRSHRVARNLR